MTRGLPLAVALAASTALTSVSSLVQAQETLYRWKWEGAIRIVLQTEDCQGDFVSNENTPAVYQPNLADVDDRKSSITIFRKTATEMIQNDSSSEQFSGDGVYNRFVIADGSLDESFGGSEDQTFDFVQTPAIADTTTNFITLSGKLHDYVNGGCTVTLRGSFVAVDSLEPPPPPPYGGG